MRETSTHFMTHNYSIHYNFVFIMIHFIAKCHRHCLSRNNVHKVVYFLSSPSLLFLPPVPLLSIVILLIHLLTSYSFCTCLFSSTFLISDSSSVVEVKGMTTGRPTCTTTVLHLVHWPAVSHIPAALLLR